MAVLDDYPFLVVGLFSAPLGTVRRAFQNSISDPSRFDVREGPLDLARVYVKRPPRGGAHAKRAVLFEPTNATGTTAMVCNLGDGWYTMCNKLADRVAGEHLLVRSSLEDEEPIADIEVWLDGEMVRIVRAMKEDPDWEFLQQGEPLTS